MLGNRKFSFRLTCTERDEVLREFIKFREKNGWSSPKRYKFNKVYEGLRRVYFYTEDKIEFDECKEYINNYIELYIKPKRTPELYSNNYKLNRPRNRYTVNKMLRVNKAILCRIALILLRHPNLLGYEPVRLYVTKQEHIIIKKILSGSVNAAVKDKRAVTCKVNKDTNICIKEDILEKIILDAISKNESASIVVNDILEKYYNTKE